MSHNTDAVVAGLSFLGQLDRIRDMPLAGTAPASAPAQAAAEPDVDARQPASLSERVKQAFAAHHLPIHNKKEIPFTTLKIACPGAPVQPDQAYTNSSRLLLAKRCLLHIS